MTNKSKILVTGGLGYIGSHTVVELIESNYEVVIIDNLSNSTIDVLEGIQKITGILPEFRNIDLKDFLSLEALFKEFSFDGIIHFSAYKAIGESFEKPLDYYENNISTLINLLKVYPKGNLIFSSSCTVYGQPSSMPVKDDFPRGKALSPYGNTKKVGEEIIQDYCDANKAFNCISLRYFNPIGAHESLEIGEFPIGKPRNLIPFITQTAIGKREKLAVFGKDYDTPDGTCIRDYIHVVDLAKAHSLSLKRLLSSNTESNYETFNLGSGKGNSILEIINTFEEVSGKKLNYTFAERRRGDIAEAYANTDKAKNTLNWQTEKSLEEAILSAWQWEQKIQKNNI